MSASLTTRAFLPEMFLRASAKSKSRQSSLLRLGAVRVTPRVTTPRKSHADAIEAPAFLEHFFDQFEEGLRRSRLWGEFAMALLQRVALGVDHQHFGTRSTDVDAEGIGLLAHGRRA